MLTGIFVFEFLAVLSPDIFFINFLVILLL